MGIRDSEREKERVCVCKRECVCERECVREKERFCACERARERERERERKKNNENVYVYVLCTYPVDPLVPTTPKTSLWTLDLPSAPIEREKEEEEDWDPALDPVCVGNLLL